MSVRRIGRMIGLALVLAGLLVLVYAGMNYVGTTRAEREAEARVPGQDTVAATGVPVEVAQATQLPTDVPSPTPVPTDTPVPATSTPVPTPTTQMVVGSQGLPKGLGADPVRIVIPRISLDTRVQEATWDVINENGQQVSEWQIPFDSVGHLKITAKPGEAGNAVISGHHNLIGPNIFGVGQFAGLWNVKDGDAIYITDSIGRTFLYQVQTHWVLKELGEPASVREQHAQQLLADDGTPMLSLETCWNGAARPLSGNTWRWIVRAKLVGTVASSQIPKVKG